MSRNHVVVIDLDNTLIDYDGLFFELAVERGWIGTDVAREKAAVKAALADDKKWQELQRSAYANEIHRARVAEEAFETLGLLREWGLIPTLVSHKTAFSALDGRTELRRPALEFLRDRGVFDFLKPEKVLFTETFEEKIETIRGLAPVLVIDDLEKVMRSPRISRLNRIQLNRTEWGAVPAVRDWEELRDLLKTMRTLEADFASMSLATIGTRSRNRVFLLEAENAKFALKLFPKNARGRASATNEVEASRALAGVERIVRSRRGFGNIVISEWIDGVEADASRAYSALRDVLRRTGRIDFRRRVQDDAETETEFAINLHSRLSDLRIESGLRVRLEEAIAELEGSGASFDTSPERRFLFSDFSPANAKVDEAGGVHLLDLEDAGLGNPHRMLANLALHPRSDVSRAVLEEMGKELGISLETTRTIFAYSYLEWICILLGCFSASRFDSALTAEEAAARQARAERRLRLFFDVGPDKRCLYERYWLHREELR